VTKPFALLARCFWLSHELCYKRYGEDRVVICCWEVFRCGGFVGVVRAEIKKVM